MKNETISPLEMMKTAAARKNKELDKVQENAEVNEETKAETPVESVEGNVADTAAATGAGTSGDTTPEDLDNSGKETPPSSEQVNQIGPAYRLPAAPCSIMYGNERHIYPDGIVRPMTQSFADFMKEFAKAGGAIVLAE